MVSKKVKAISYFKKNNWDINTFFWFCLILEDRAEIIQIFQLLFWRFDDFINLFWFNLTFGIGCFYSNWPGEEDQYLIVTRNARIRILDRIYYISKQLSLCSKSYNVNYWSISLIQFKWKLECVHSPIINLYKLIRDRKLHPKFDHTFVINSVDLVACYLLSVLYIHKWFFVVQT